MNKLKKTWWIATGALIIAIGLFILSFLALRQTPNHTIWLAIKAFSEASMVGALADWFAIVALFRHPLGIPIPHTAVLVRGRARVASAIAHFVADNFLTPSVITPKLRAYSPARQLSRWLSRREHAESLLSVLSNFTPAIHNFLASDGIKRFLKNNLTPLILQFPLSKSAAIALRNLKDTPVADNIVGKLSEEALSFVRDNREELEHQVAENLPIPSFKAIPLLNDLRDGIASMIAPLVMDKVSKYLADVSSETTHPLRLRIKERLSLLAERLEHDEEFALNFEIVKNSLLSNETTDTIITHLISAIQTGLVNDLLTPGTDYYRKAVISITHIGKSLELNSTVLEQIDDSLIEFTTKASELYRDKIKEEIRQVVLSWDTKEMISKIEEQVGNDLQFIRLNGTLVGGCIGLVLFLITWGLY